MRKRELCILNNKLDTTLILFKNVVNAKNILESYNKHISDFNDTNHFFLLLDSELIFNENHILHSIYRAYYNFITKKRITKNMILEIFFLLSPHENINECLKQYQIKNDSSSIIYVGLNVTNEEIDTFVDLIEGERINFNEISFLHDKKKISDNFKCTDINNLEKFIYHNIASKKLNLS
ncbi:EKC/KEOPS complex subunit CGI121, putative [Plasmodium gallinaceum]|uniref:EKC/KEOPS complex subunit CGI121, putative n=1 Tax=Plasmodium gallinaceum TaxID=5849 RepID=A0A1J1H330_PLAGA|nr:EKC/KEOPS complex subunit CGI121, putative [Plasmodium gallinaceum]CRG97893.1 EKC/KEOPS complex subunit CGI121, putative [Plasmodium gallinaceum]